jgi:FlaA1/EpsC-like NDP-sugar epimerase
MKLYFSREILRSVPGLAGIFRGFGTWMIFDIPVVLGAYGLALLARSITADVNLTTGLIFTFLVTAAFMSANKLFGVYRRYWSYAAAHDALALVSASTVATLLIGLINFFLEPRPLPSSVVLVGGVFALLGQLAIRYRRRMFSSFRWALRNSLFRLISDGAPTLIVGAGESGQALAYKLQMGPQSQQYRVVGFVDDDANKQQYTIHGLPVLGNCLQIPLLAERHGVELIIIAIHNAEPPRLRELVDLCMQTHAQIRFAPDSLSTLNGKAKVAPLRDVTIQDLLGRPPHAIDSGQVADLIQGRRVLVTGACGSIGSELVRQIRQIGPARLILLDNNESAMHDLVMSFDESPATNSGSAMLHPVIGDVTLPSQLDSLFAQEQPELVFHAAAYKHVLWMEAFPLQAIRVNVLGTANLLEAARRHGAERFILISSDKAVDPSSIMGATKRLCELLVLQGGRAADGAHPRLCCSAVRFGNVIGSRGSVVPTFERQIDHGGPVTLTDKRMRRFFMSIGEAVSLVLMAATLTEGQDLFMLEMGEEVPILELAQRMIRLRGLRPDVDISIVEVGTRPGEKLSETLLGAGEVGQPTRQAGIQRIQFDLDIDACRLAATLDAMRSYGYEYREEEAVQLLWSLLAQTSAGPTAAPGLMVAEAPARNGVPVMYRGPHP